MLSFCGFATSPERQEQESNQSFFSDVMKCISVMTVIRLGFFESTTPEITVPLSALTIITALFRTDLEYWVSLSIAWFATLKYRLDTPRFSF